MCPVRSLRADLGLEPLTARSVALSALLGTHPPRLPVRALVALGGLFGIAEGTMRTALSRMVASGDVEIDDGRYVLGERFRRRQATQDAARHPAPEPWDGTWWFAIVDRAARSVAQRRSFRASMTEARMGELRPGVWLRPANIDGPAVTDGVLVVRGSPEQRDPRDLARELWDLGALATRAGQLAGLVDDASGRLRAGDPAVLADTFLVSVATVRFLRTEPMLPRALLPRQWPAERLRSAYDRLEAAHASLMAAFLAGASEPVPAPYRD
jgi:phenylacetic acid degradation operon negative regulatory protein